MDGAILTVFENIACTQCGGVCDDLRSTVDGGRVVRAEGACEIAEPWYLAQESQHPPAAAIREKSVSIEAALDRAAEILSDSCAPLIYGLSRSSTDGQRAAVALADRLGATIDTTASLCHGPSIIALQQAGESTSSLGEIRNRSDLVVFWGCDPVVSHPRHLERYSVDPVGEFVPAGRGGRTIVVVDNHPTASSALADLFIEVEPDGDFEALWTLRSLIHGTPPTPGSRTGARLEVLADLAERMKQCTSGVAFFGLG